MAEFHESEVNIISENTSLEGSFCFHHTTRIHGTITGKIENKEESELILSETGSIKGYITADTVIIDGFFEGEIRAKKRVVLSQSAKVIGKIDTPSLEISFGAYFDGETKMSP